jgi:sulfur carrier protein ThiS
MEVPSGTSVRNLTHRFGLAAGYAWLLPVSVNGAFVEKSHVLEEGDVVVFIFPISGG